MKKILLSLMLFSSLVFSSQIKVIPIDKSLLAHENGGNKHAIDAYSDGIGLFVENNKIDNHPLNELVFVHGEKSKKNNLNLKEYVLNNGTEKEKLIANELGNLVEQKEYNIGDSCNDNNSSTVNDIYVDNIGTCKGIVLKNKNECYGDEIGSIFLYNGDSYLVVDNNTILTNLGRTKTLCTSNVTSMKNLFKDNTFFNEDISEWDTSNVKTMESMFMGATNFNKNINNWNTSNVTDMRWMFYNATNFNQPLNNWNTSNVTTMRSMFNNAISFNQPLNNWDTSNVSEMVYLFNGATNFNQNINNWDVSKVTNMSWMFNGAINFNQPLNNWNLSNVTEVRSMFYSAENFNQPLNNWNTSNIVNMRTMFSGANKFNQPLNNWDVSKVTNMYYMFYNTFDFNQNISNWNVTNVDTWNNFYGNSALNITNVPDKLK